MRVENFDFELPEDRIALRPARPRDSAKMLVVKAGQSLADREVRNLPEFLEPGDVLVLNDTRVIRAQLEGRRDRFGAQATVGLTLHRRVASDAWLAFARGAKKLKVGDRLRFGGGNAACMAGSLDATITEKRLQGEVLVRFDMDGVYLDEAVAAAGQMPLPPYIAHKRDVDEQDRQDYQTVYADKDGAVAAPTAGLHFTAELFERLAAMGVQRHFVTLHVGAGTFLPMKSTDTEHHRMYAETGVITEQTAAALNEARQKGGRIVAIGTTSLRLLESAADDRGLLHPFEGETEIFITPGHRFRAVDLLMTNFHLPRSTLFMLVAAFSGLDRMKAAYTHAIGHSYRFYSYGDACLLYPAG
jgi:S-adenosylmethionine:tRNA ribosyltransferase-isomerase